MHPDPDPAARDIVEPVPFDPAPEKSPTRDDAADALLAAKLRPWCYRQHIGTNQAAANAAAAWLRARGL
jgi:hypothetical protein